MLTRALTLFLGIVTFLSPLLFWTLTPNFYATPKEALFYLTLITLLILYAFNSFKTRSLSLPTSPLALPLILFSLATTLTLLANPEGRPEALAGKGLILLLLPLFTLLLQSLPNLSQLTATLELALIASSSVLSLHSLLSLTLLHRLSFLPTFMQQQSFTPTGSYYTTATIIILGLILALSKLSTLKHLPRNLTFVYLTLSVVSLVAIFSSMLPGGALTPNLVPYQASWGITLDALKSARSLFLGIGLSNYSLLYTAVKPLSLNTTNLWNLLPTSSHSELLTLLATGGLFLTTTFLYLFIRSFLRTTSPSHRYLLLALFLTFLLFPAGLPHYFLAFTVFAIGTATPPHSVSLKSHSRFLVPSVILLATLGLSYLVLRPLLAEYSLRQAQLALARNDGKGVYDHHLQALRYAPRISNYQLSFATTNLNLASALSQKPNLSDEDRRSIAQLIQQSIQSAKNASSLRPNDSNTWLALAYTYQNLINVAQGAEDFSLSAYAQALSLDRANPELRVKFGGLLTQLYTQTTDSNKKTAYYSRALTEFQTAIQLKSDYANSYYNLSKLYQAANQFDLAKTALKEALKYLPPSSQDYAQAENELSNLDSAQPASNSATASASTNSSPLTPSPALTTPSPLPEEPDGGPIALPNP